MFFFFFGHLAAFYLLLGHLGHVHMGGAFEKRKAAWKTAPALQGRLQLTALALSNHCPLPVTSTRLLLWHSQTAPRKSTHQRRAEHPSASLPPTDMPREDLIYDARENAARPAGRRRSMARSLQTGEIYGSAAALARRAAQGAADVGAHAAPTRWAPPMSVGVLPTGRVRALNVQPARLGKRSSSGGCDVCARPGVRAGSRDALRLRRACGLSPGFLSLRGGHPHGVRPALPAPWGRIRVRHPCTESPGAARLEEKRYNYSPIAHIFPWRGKHRGAFFPECRPRRVSHRR
ncbi:hypothetical protein DFH09DRAFT_1075502 [Mycena vulgaris]|nr:hypothetical protein DFH09DRAFT_1075502 [Mycena vulgaris]